MTPHPKLILVAGGPGAGMTSIDPYGELEPIDGIDWLVLHNDRSSRVDDLVGRALQWT